MPTYSDSSGPIKWNDGRTRVEAQHYSTQASGTGISASNLASNVSSVTFATGSTDAAGVATINFNSASPGAGVVICHVVFGSAFISIPFVIIGPASSPTGSTAFFCDSADTTASYFVVRNVTALSSFSGSLKVSYHVVGQTGG